MESSTLLLLAWEERSPREDQELGREEVTRTRRGERRVVRLSSMVMLTQLRERETVTVLRAAVPTLTIGKWLQDT